MKKFFYVFALLLCLAAHPAAADTQFSSAVSDLPLMPGMAEIPDTIVVFDKPQGRIVDFSVTTPTASEAVVDFYAQSLPALGWQSIAPTQYTRDNELLALSFEPGGKVHFSIKPKD